jgi:phage replication-related protein YjqB (UPF0714/DUF867 family)
MPDTYKNFEELSRHEKEGIDYKVEIQDRASAWAVLAIHGGNIEPGTTEIARLIAGGTFSFYSFIGRKTMEGESRALHITSSHFDEPQGLALVTKSEKVISIHGEGSAESFIMVGGRDSEMIEKMKEILKSNGFELREAPDNLNGDSEKNICNRCLSKKGMQLEISRGLRNTLLSNPGQLQRFCGAVRGMLTP